MNNEARARAWVQEHRGGGGLGNLNPVPSLTALLEEVEAPLKKRIEELEQDVQNYRFKCGMDL